MPKHRFQTGITVSGPIGDLVVPSNESRAVQIRVAVRQSTEKCPGCRSAPMTSISAGICIARSTKSYRDANSLSAPRCQWPGCVSRVSRIWSQMQHSLVDGHKWSPEHLATLQHDHITCQVHKTTAGAIKAVKRFSQTENRPGFLVPTIDVALVVSRLNEL